MQSNQESEFRRRDEDEAVDAADLSLYERYYLAIDVAKNEARRTAERRVLETDAKWWLAHGPARNDWRLATTDKSEPQVQQEVQAQADSQAQMREPARLAEVFALAIQLASAEGYPGVAEAMRKVLAGDVSDTSVMMKVFTGLADRHATQERQQYEADPDAWLASQRPS